MNPAAVPRLGLVTRLKRLVLFRDDPPGFLQGIASRHGDLVRLQVPGVTVFLVSHPELVQEVLVTKNRHFVKSLDTRYLRHALGDGLVTSEGETWLRQRRLMQPAFHKARIAAYTRVMGERTEAMLATWRDGQQLDLHAAMAELTLDIVARTLFGAEVGEDTPRVGAAIAQLMEGFAAYLGSPVHLPVWVPTPSHLKRREAVADLDRIVYRLIEARRRADEPRDDLLQVLLDARDEGDGRGMTDTQLRDEVITLFSAGHETTAVALTWTMVLLARHPEVEAGLAEEVRAVLGDRPPTVDDLEALAPVTRTVKEGMRLYPPVWAIGREAKEDVEIGGHRIPRGAQVVMSQWIVHRDRRFHPHPLRFDPDRFLPEGEAAMHRFAYFPFGGGQRLCIGERFALVEATLILASILQRFRVGLAPDHTIRTLASVTLRPRDGVPAILTARR